MFDKKILDSIRYHTNRIAKTFRLEGGKSKRDGWTKTAKGGSFNDPDDVRQTLYLAALEAWRTYDPSRRTRKSTYIKAAVAYRAIDIMRCLERSPQVVCCEEDDDLEDLARFHRKRQRDVHAELSNSNTPKSRKPVHINCGTQIQTV